MVSHGNLLSNTDYESQDLYSKSLEEKDRINVIRPQPPPDFDNEIDNEDSELVLELPEDSDEEVSNEIAEEMKNYEPSTVNTCK